MMSLSIIPAVASIVLLIFGVMLLYFPPKKINGYYGYRMPQACRDQKSWDFAQKYFGKLMVPFNTCSTVVCGTLYIMVRYFDLEIDSGALVLVYNILPVIAALTALALTEFALYRLKQQKQ